MTARRATTVLLTAFATLLAMIGATTPAQAAPVTTKIITYVLENHDLYTAWRQMPYLRSQAEKYGYAKRLTAVGRPSFPNYVALAEGDTMGQHHNSWTNPQFHGANIFDEGIAAGKTAKTYVTGMPSNCNSQSTGFANPWIFEVDPVEHANCLAFDQPYKNLAPDIAAGTLPNVSMVLLDGTTNAHSSSLTPVSDPYVQQQMERIYAGPDWKSGHLAVVWTFDEPDDSQPLTTPIFTVVIAPSVQGVETYTPMTLYSIVRLEAQVLHVVPPRQAATAASMRAAFGLHVGLG